MASENYKRVSRKRVCQICGKSDWCSYTPDEKITFCARVNKAADRVSRTGWGVFYHEKPFFPIDPFFFPRRPPPKSAELASLEIRDFAYRTLIRLSPSTDSKEIIDGEKGLRSRKILNFEDYGSLPKTQNKRRELVKEIHNLIDREFPDFVKHQKSGFGGIPGFWLDKKGQVQLWLEKDYSCPMMIIPYRAPGGLVQACQIRFMNRRIAGDSVRYVWLSTPDKSGTVSCGSPLHFASYDDSSFDKPILITEGALKAETSVNFFRDFNVLASAGVNCSHDEIVKAVLHHNSIFIAFDSDYYENHYVARALAKLLSSILAQRTPGVHNRIKILTWSCEYKGIDDALLENVPIISRSIFEWYESIGEKCRNETKLILPESPVVSK